MADLTLYQALAAHGFTVRQWAGGGWAREPVRPRVGARSLFGPDGSWLGIYTASEAWTLLHDYVAEQAYG